MEHLTIGRLASIYQLPLGSVRKALSDAGIEPSLLLNEQTFYPADVACAVVAKIGHGRIERRTAKAGTR
jgi:hypothetical protein